MVEKLEKDGKVAVLISGGYGAGWSTWVGGDKAEEALFDPVLAQMIIDEKPLDDLINTAKERYPDGYYGGLRDVMRVEWLDKGTKFMVDEYDGSERIIKHPEDLIYTA